MSCQCCTCGKGGSPKAAQPLICLVPEATKSGQSAGASRGARPTSAPTMSSIEGFEFLDEETIKKHCNLPPRALYLDPFRRPSISFPMSQNKISNFTIHRKQQINKGILDGLLDPSEAITAPSTFPYDTSEAEKQKEQEEDEEIIYILQLPDLEYVCPDHGEVVRTPRFIWHSCKKSTKKAESDGPVQGGGPLNRPKPWLLSRHTDFDAESRW